MLCARCSCLPVRASKSPKPLAGYLTLRDSVSQQAGLAGTPALFAIAGLPALLDNSKLTLFDCRVEMSSKGHFSRPWAPSLLSRAMEKGAASSDGSKGTVTCCHVTHMHRSSEMFAVRYSVVLTDAICDSISGHARSFSKSVSVTAKVMTQARSGGILRSCTRRSSFFCNTRLDGSQQ